MNAKLVRQIYFRMEMDRRKIPAGGFIVTIKSNEMSFMRCAGCFKEFEEMTKAYAT
jgi:hypothetical protein